MRWVSKQRGFTLIELVIVLAIAALVLAAILLAVGGAQRSQRDNETKNAAAKVTAAFQNYASNNAGTMPLFGHSLPAGYLSNIYDGKGFAPSKGTSAKLTHDIRYEGSAICDVLGSTPAIIATAQQPSQQYAVDYWQEAAGDDICIDNQ